MRLRIAKLIEQRPQFMGSLNFLHTDSRCLGTRLQEPGRFDTRHKIVESFMIEDVNKFGNGNARFLRAAAHGKLVAKVANGRETHPGDTQMLAQSCGVFEIKFVEGDNTVDGLPAGE